MGSPARRTWTLAALPRDRRYLLWFCPKQRRWEVEAVDAPEQPERAEASGAQGEAAHRTTPPVPASRSAGPWPAPV